MTPRLADGIDGIITRYLPHAKLQTFKLWASVTSSTTQGVYHTLFKRSRWRLNPKPQTLNFLNAVTWLAL